jgi:hypothetical protein
MLQSDTLHGIIPWVDGLTFVGIVAGAAKASDWLDSMLNDTGRAAITKWLKNVSSDAQDDSWSQALSGLIDRVFGERPFSFKFFRRSCVASFVAVGLVSIFYVRVRLRSHLHIALLQVFFNSFIFGLIPDYLSLLTSRAILILISRNPRLLRIVLFLLADALISPLISIGGMLTIMVLISTVEPSFSINHPLQVIPDFYHAFFSWRAFTFSSGTVLDQLSVLFYSSFFTSIWLWLYVIVGFAMKATRRIHVSQYLDIDKKPLGCIGKMSGLVLASLWAIFIGVEHTLHYLYGH